MRGWARSGVGEVDVGGLLAVAVRWGRPAQGVVRLELGVPAAFVDGLAVSVAEQDEVVLVGGAAVGPGADVVGAVTGGGAVAGGEAAVLVTGVEAAALGGARVSVAAAEVDDGAGEGVGDEAGEGGVAGQAAGHVGVEWGVVGEVARGVGEAEHGGQVDGDGDGGGRRPRRFATSAGSAGSPAPGAWWVAAWV